MALRFVDSGGDYYSTAQLGRKWSIIAGAVAVVAGAGRRGTNGLNAVNSTYVKTLDAQATWIAGLSYKSSTIPFATTPGLIAFDDSLTEQVSVRINNAGQLLMTRNGTVLQTSVNALLSGVEYYIEFKCTISDAAGSYEVRVNGSSTGWLSGSGVDTKNTANASANQVRFQNASTTGPATLDDFYICDGTGATNNTFLGDVRVDALLPTGAGANTGFTPSAGSNFQCVDENPANDDTDYVQANVVATKDTYTFADITHNPTTVFGVQVNMVARKDDAGSRSIASVVRSGGADTAGTAQPLATTYANYAAILELDPNGAIPWTKAAVNAAEYGHDVAA